MEENTAAVECLILFYINTKHVLKTKQLDERVFLDQMIRHCKENGFDSYSNEEIRNTWKNLTLKYVELKKTGTPDEKESWKYYEILDSCFEQSDFHNGVYPKFSEEMVWFLIECFLKRKALEKTQKKNSMLNEIHKDFLQSGYLYITRQDIENKWKYLNFKYDKLKDDPEALNKLPYLQAIRGFRVKDRKCLVKMIFTRELTEILIERFTEKKITCVIHGYDSEQVLSEIQSEFRQLGFDFAQEEIKERWRKLTNIYTFLKAKGKHDSPWIFFSAMKEHFKDDFLFGFRAFERELREERQERHKSLRQRSKSVGAEARRRYNRDEGKSKLIVNIEPLDDEKLSPSPKKSSVEKKPRATKRKQSPKKSVQDVISDLCKSPKKPKIRSKSRDSPRKNKINDDVKQQEPVASERNSLSARRNHHLKSLSIDRSQDRRGSADIGSPGSKVHIINIDESKIDKKSGNLTINLPSITKQFSDNEFLPLKKRLRLGGDNSDKLDESKDIQDGFRGFPPTHEDDTQKKSNENERKKLTEDEMEEIMKKIHEDAPEKYDANSITFPEDKNYKTDYSYQGTYNNFNPPCLLVPKEEKDNLPVQNYPSNEVTPPPVLLLVIKVDGSNNPAKDSENKKQIEKESSESPSKNEPIRLKSNLNIVKPINPKNKNCTVTNSDTPVVDAKSDLSSCQSKKEDTVNTNSELQVKNNGLVRVSPNGKSISVTLNEKITVQSPQKSSEAVPAQDKSLETNVTVQTCATVDRKTEEPVIVDTIPFVASETVIPAVPEEPSTKRIRLPVKGGGNVKEIFISPRELKKLAKIKPGDFKPTTSPTKPVDNIVKNTTTEVNPLPKAAPPKFKFLSQVIRPPTIKVTPDNISEPVFQKPKVIPPSTEANCMLPPPMASKFVGTNNSASRSLKSEEFENESVFSEAVGDDECLKDNLLATVIDFQEQNNQEFVEIKNLMKQNNLLQRETNRLLRLMLEKM